MSGPNPPGPDSEGSDTPEQEPGEQPAEDHRRPGCDGPDRYPLAGVFGARVRAIHRGPVRARRPRPLRLRRLRPDRTRRYRPSAALALGGRHCRDHRRGLPRRVGVDAGDGNRLRQPCDAGNEHDDIGAAGAGRDHHHDAATAAAPATAAQRGAAASATGDRHGDAGAGSTAPSARGRTAATAGRDPPPPPPTTTTRSGPRQVTYSVTGTKAPGDIITITYVDASGRSRTQRNVYIPWSLTVTPISQSEVGSVQASSLFLVSRLNCSITTSDGTVLSSNTGNSAQTSC